MATAMKKKPKAKKPRPPKTKQPYLDPEMEPPHIKELDGAAENYYDAMQERLPYTAAEAEAKDSLLALMAKHGQTRYEFGDFVVTKSDTANVSVKKKKKPVADDPNEDESAE